MARLDLHLTVGKTNETVTVTADSSLINYETQTLEGGVSPEALQSFPLTVSGAPRSSVAVAIMMPGVTSAGGGNAFNARSTAASSPATKRWSMAPRQSKVS